jgi:hypothetical protein
MHRGPFLFQTVPTVHHLLADYAFIDHARLAGYRCREIVFFRVFAHGAVGGEARG